jgi:hypothetical protein
VTFEGDSQNKFLFFVFPLQVIHGLLRVGFYLFLIICNWHLFISYVRITFQYTIFLNSEGHGESDCTKENWVVPFEWMGLILDPCKVGLLRAIFCIQFVVLLEPFNVMYRSLKFHFKWEGWELGRFFVITLYIQQSFHSHIKSQFYSSHPSIFIFVDVLLRLQTFIYKQNKKLKHF